MRAKFIGGPYHGKVKDVNVSPHGTRVTDFDKNPHAARYGGVYPPQAMVSFNTHIYEIRMMSVTIDGINYRAPAMHPDGSIYLVHENYGKKKR